MTEDSVGEGATKEPDMTAARKTREEIEVRIAERGGKGAGGAQRRPPNRPWRTEGLPPGSPGGPPKEPRKWWGFVARAILIFAIAFAILTMQDRVTGLVTISYSEFVKQVDVVPSVTSVPAGRIPHVPGSAAVP